MTNFTRELTTIGHLNKRGGFKRPYQSLDEAVEAANSETMRLGCFRMVPYQCSFCGKFHIGKPDYAATYTKSTLRK